MGIHEDALAYLRSLYGEGKRFPHKSKLAEFLGVAPIQLDRHLTGERGKHVKGFLEMLERAGVGLSFPSDHIPSQTRDIEFVNPKIVGIENGAPPPVSEDYLAVPLAEEAIAAGPGLMPQDALRGWVIVWRHHDSVRFRTDLVAVEIGKGQTSMVPHLHPGDIVLVDKADRRPDVDGKIMLVCDPDGGCAVKRVSSAHVDGDIELVFYSDNAAENRPRVFRLNRDYGGQLEAAIGGRVVWAWSDMTRK